MEAIINYVTYDDVGNLTGSYLQVLHPDHVDCYIEVDAEQRLAWTSYRANQARDGLEMRSPVEPPAPTEAQIVAAGMALIDGLLHRVANSYGYDSIITMMSYAEEPAVERYQLEGKAARAWRSLCWFKAEQIRDAVKAGEREQPTDTELLAEMPVIDLPYPGPFA